MSSAVRAPVLGEQVPLFIIIGLAIVGVLSALLTANALGEQASRRRARVLRQAPAASASKDAPGTEASPSAETAAATPSAALNEQPNPRPALAAEPPRADCPDFPRFSFRVGRSMPVDDLDDEVRVLIAWMKQHPRAVLVIEGHADATGGPKRNLSLSFDRARSVSELFMSQGLGEQRMDVEAYGAFRPIERRDGPSAVDRRVSLRTTGEPVCPHREGNEP